MGHRCSSGGSEATRQRVPTSRCSKTTVSTSSRSLPCQQISHKSRENRDSFLSTASSISSWLDLITHLRLLANLPSTWEITLTVAKRLMSHYNLRNAISQGRNWTFRWQQTLSLNISIGQEPRSVVWPLRTIVLLWPTSSLLILRTRPQSGHKLTPIPLYWLFTKIPSGAPSKNFAWSKSSTKTSGKKSQRYWISKL